jgi:tetratricopeptide (TPR) repeat protein
MENERSPLVINNEPNTASFTLEEWLQLFQDPNRSKKNVDEVPQDVEGLKILMKEGAWKSVIKLAVKCMINSKSPVEKLQYRVWSIIGKIEMKQFESAHSEFRDIGAFDDSKNLFQTYSEYAPKSGSLVPLNLRLLYAMLPCYLSKRDAKLDCLYCLLAFANATNNTVFEQMELPLLNHLSLQPITIGLFEEPELKNFANRVAFAVISELCNTGEFIQAIQLLGPIVKEYPNDIILLSSMARIYLQTGNVVAGDVIFNRIEEMILKNYPENSENSDAKNQAYVILHSNRGYKSLSHGKFEEVTVHFQNVLKIDPNNAMATNNLALGWLYTGKLQQAIKCLEEFISSDFSTNLKYESTVLNLCTLYDLACHDSMLKKRHLLTQAARYLPDNFDLSTFKIPDITVTSLF